MTDRPAGETEPRATGDKVEYEDVDDIIGIATEMTQADEQKLSLEDVKRVGVELGIREEYVERAIRELERRREAASTAERERAARRRRLMKRAMIAAACLLSALVLVYVVGASAAGDLREELATVEQKRAQVRNVLDRQAAVVSRLRDMPPGPDRDADLAGTENRIAIERRRYDEAAARYNASAGSFPSTLWVSLFGLPERAPLSNEVTTW